MRPGVPLLWSIVLWGIAGFLCDWFRISSPLWGFTGWAILGIAVLDWLLLRFEKPLQVHRELPEFLALGVSHEIPLKITNPLRRKAQVKVFDGVPETCETEFLPWTGEIAIGGFVEINYRVTPLERGPQEFDKTHILLTSLLWLWQRPIQIGIPGTVKVFPNYQPILKFNLLAMTNKAAQMGIRALNRPGQSREFRQLREFQEGDPLNKLDWKATSRRLSLISREYEEQRDQTIILAVDCGRRLAVLDGDLPQFDHCLNAMLLLSHVALRQGDAVGVLGVGGEGRWLPPQKGTNFMAPLLQHLYDYQTENHPTDFGEAVRVLMARQKRRALVIFLTNLRSEDAAHLLEPLKVLRRKHLVILASLCEQELTTKLQQPVTEFNDALTLTAGHLYMEERKGLFGLLEKEKIITLDCSARELPTALTNRYLEIKKSGAI